MSLPLGYPINGGSSRQWYTKFSSVITTHGFQQCSADHSLFTKGSGDNYVVLLVCVDDILVAGPNLSLVPSCYLLPNFA